jgi:hypothetical protein
VTTVAEQPDIPAAMRAHYDQAISEAVDLLLAEAAAVDHLDVIEANVGLTARLFLLMQPAQLAAAAAALAIRLHRSQEVAS